MEENPNREVMVTVVPEDQRAMVDRISAMPDVEAVIVMGTRADNSYVARRGNMVGHVQSVTAAFGTKKGVLRIRKFRPPVPREEVPTVLELEEVRYDV